MSTNIRKQAATLTFANALTRLAGFFLHLLFARWMGAEAMGVMEQAHAAQMLALTPVTSGIPAAMSRLTARKPACDQQAVLRAGISLILHTVRWLLPALVFLSPLWAYLTGGFRALPALLCAMPGIVFLGLGAVYGGYCCGQGRAAIPARGECVEQGVRMALALLLLALWGGRSVSLTAALPAIAESLAAVAAWALLHRCCPLLPSCAPSSRTLERQLFSLATPAVCARLCTTSLRAVAAVLVPVCLQRSGLSAREATAQYGLFSGMALPLMMLPGILTGAVSTAAVPAVARLEQQRAPLRRLLGHLLLAGLSMGLAAWFALRLCSGFLATTLYRQPALSPIVNALSPAATLFSLQQVMHGAVTGLGLQRRALTGTLLGGAAQLIVTALLCPMPAFRIMGFVAGMLCGQLLSCLYTAFLLLSHLSQKN